jgi:site-specific recombinase XerD
VTRGAPDLSPREAAQRWLDRKRDDSADQSVTTLYYRLKQFWEWCEREGIEHMSELTPWTIDEFETERRKEVILLTLDKQFGTLQQWLEWCAVRGLVDEDVVEAVDPPTVPTQQKSSDIKLDGDDAIPLLAFYRSDEEYRATRRHVVLELLWNIGCRMGGLRALDLRDFGTDDVTGSRYLYFRHRPESGTPLKNKTDGERPVWVSDTVADLVEEYIDTYRERRRDEHGRQPLITSSVGRPSRTTIRTDCYFATAPCYRIACPHGREDMNCEFFDRAAISKCPSTRSPHQVRTGSITWQLGEGVSMTTVSERVNASVDVIEEFYNKPDPMKALRKRRAPELQRIDLGGDIDELNDFTEDSAA